MTTTGLVQADGVRPLIAPTKSGSGRVPIPSAQFMRGSQGSGAKWRPALRAIADDVDAAWEPAVARATDLIQNSGWISGMFDQAVANTVGQGLRLVCAPENDLFGWSEEETRQWRNLVERRWGIWSESAVACDVEGRRTIPQMQEAAFRHWLNTGEILGELVWRRRFGSQYGTKVRLLPATKLDWRSDTLNNTRSGVVMDRDGFPIAYMARRKTQAMGAHTVRVAARDRYGRPKVIHVFVGQPGQVRGITPLVPAMKVAKQFDQLADSTLLAALIQTVFAANLQSDAPTEEALMGMLTPQEQAQLRSSGVSPFEAWVEMQSGWNNANTIDIGIGGRVVSTFPGQKLEFLSPEQPQSAYKDFAMHLLREIARCLGLTYESATGDYDGATYSSVRMAVNEIFQITLARRKFVVKPFLQPIYEAWLEEEIAFGRIPFPGGYPAFLVNRAAASRALWIGSPKPVADDLKAAKAHQVYRDMGVISDEMIAADLGVNIDDVYAARARERDLRASYTLSEPASGPAISDQVVADTDQQTDTTQEGADG
jgi:lambda family phage portal protein